MGINIREYVEKELLGFDLEVTNDKATLQDYLDVINKLILEERLERTRKAVEDCEGCNGCCSERIPLTFTDVQKIIQAPYIKEMLGEEATLKEVLEAVSQITVDGRSVDIILERDRRGTCVFLNKDTNLCKVYQYRPLVCQTFICCPQSERVKNLREQIVNTGEDELVRQWLLNCLKLKEPFFFHEAYDPDLRLEDWHETPADKGEYSEILIKEICTPELWADLKKKGV